jgi:hypothetical protein
MERDMSEVQAAIAALGEVPDGDDSDDAKDRRHQLDLFRARERDLKILITHIRNDLASQIHQHDLVRHQLASINADIAMRSTRLAHIQQKITDLQVNLQQTNQR